MTQTAASPWSADRLRQHARWAGVLLVATALVPHETIDQRAMFLWQLLPGMPAGLRLASLAPVAAGLVVLVGSFACRGSASLGILAMGACGGAVSASWATAVCAGQRWTGARAASPIAIVVALVVAALHLRHASSAEGAAASPWRERALPRALLCAATVVAATYEWASPWFDETATDTLLRVIGRVALRPTAGPVIVCLLIAPFALWPWVALGLGWVDVLVPGRRRRPLAMVVAFHTVPAWPLPVMMRALVGVRGDAGIVPLAGEVLVVACTSTLMAHALAMVLASSAPSADSGQPRARVANRSTWAVVGGVVAFVVVCCAMARERPPELAWQPAGGSADAERLYAALIPAWNDGRGSAADVLATARAVDVPLGDALERVSRAADRDDATPLGWQQLVGDVNGAAARARLPYYLEASDIVVPSIDGAPRSFRLDTHRIASARRFASGDRLLTTLHVRSATAQRARVHTLGSSREADPFVIVSVDAIEAYARELEALAGRRPLGCLERPPQPPIEDEARSRCGELLTRVASSALVEQLTATVERHELQHRIDGERLQRAVLVARRLALHDIDAQRRVNRELSAYLAQMALDGSAPTLTLVRLFRFAALDRAGVEGLTALLALEALLGGDGDAAPRFDAAFAEVAALEPSALRERAAIAWQAQYRARLPQLEPVQ